MRNRMFCLLIFFIVGLLSGCATAPRVAGVDMPSYIKPDTFYTQAALKEITARAESGNPEAQMELTMVYTGYGSVPADLKLSNFWLEKAAAQDYLLAVSALGSRRYNYSKWGYPKDIALAEKLSYRAYEIYLSKPASEWSAYETVIAASALMRIAEYHLDDKDLAQKLLCTAHDMKPTEKNTVIVLNQFLTKIGRKCK